MEQMNLMVTLIRKFYNLAKH